MLCQCSHGTMKTQPCMQLPRPQRSNLQYSSGTLTQTSSPSAGDRGYTRLQPPAPMQDCRGHETPHAEEPPSLPQPLPDMHSSQQPRSGFVEGDQGLQCRQPSRAPRLQSPFEGVSLLPPPPAVGDARIIHTHRHAHSMSWEEDRVPQRRAAPAGSNLQHACRSQQSALALPTHSQQDSDEPGDSLSLPFPDFSTRDFPPPHPASVSTQQNLTLPGGARPPSTCTLDTCAEPEQCGEGHHIHASDAASIGPALAFGIGLNSRRHPANRTSQHRLGGAAHSLTTFEAGAQLTAQSKSRPSDRTAHGGGWRSTVYGARRPCTGPIARRPRTAAPEHQVQAHSA